MDRQGRVAAAEQAMQGLSIQAGHAAGPPHLQDKEAAASQQPAKVSERHAHNHAPHHDKMETGRGAHDSNGSSGGQSVPPSHGKKMSWANIASQPAKPPPPPSKTKKPGVLPPPVVGGAKPHNMDIGTWDTAAKHNGVPPPVIAGPPPPGPPPKINGSMNSRGGGGLGVAGPRGVKAPGGAPPFLGPANGSAAHHGPPPSPPSHPVLDELQSVNDYNPRDFDMNPKNARFFVLKSYSEDDIHRSIKYEIWCSTEHGNKRLDSAFKEREGRGPVFLFFSVNGSGHFCGMAEMLSCLDYNSSAGVWAQDKWKGRTINYE